MSSISETQKEQLRRLFEQDYGPKRVSEELNIPYNIVKNEKNKWLIKERGFDSATDYQNFLLNQKGLTQLQYKTNLIKKKLFRRLKSASIIRRYGEEVAQEIIDEYFVIRSKIWLKKKSSGAFLSAAACRVLRTQGEVAAFKDVCRLFSSNKWKAIEIYKRVYGEETKPEDTESLIKKAVVDLELPSHLEERMLEFYKRNHIPLVKSKPNARAAVCVYSIARDMVEKKDVYSSLGITLPTLNSLLKILDRNKI